MPSAAVLLARGKLGGGTGEGGRLPGCHLLLQSVAGPGKTTPGHRVWIVLGSGEDAEQSRVERSGGEEMGQPGPP